MAIDPRDFSDLKNSGPNGGLGDFKEIDAEFLKKAKLSWLTRLLMVIALPWMSRRLMKELGGPSVEMSKKAHAFFTAVNRVDIIPSRSEVRGFQIVIDNILSIFFCQDGDHFVYDGFEMGPYESGDVTVFDDR